MSDLNFDLSRVPKVKSDGYLKVKPHLDFGLSSLLKVKSDGVIVLPTCNV